MTELTGNIRLPNQNFLNEYLYNSNREQFSFLIFWFFSGLFSRDAFLQLICSSTLFSFGGWVFLKLKYCFHLLSPSDQLKQLTRLLPALEKIFRNGFHLKHYCRFYLNIWIFSKHSTNIETFLKILLKYLDLFKAFHLVIHDFWIVSTKINIQTLMDPHIPSSLWTTWGES